MNCHCLAISTSLSTYLGRGTPTGSHGARISYVHIVGVVTGSCRKCAGGCGDGDIRSSLEASIGVFASAGLFSNLATATAHHLAYVQ